MKELKTSTKKTVMMSKLDSQLSFLNQYKDAGLLFLRIGIGLSFLTLHGWDKLVASHALEMAFVFLGITIVRPGKYSLDYWPNKKD